MAREPRNAWISLLELRGHTPAHARTAALMSPTRRAPAIVAVRRKSALLAAASVLLVAIGLEGYAVGYPLGMSMLAASTVQGAICRAMFRSPLLKGMLATNFLLLVFHATVIGQFLAAPDAPAVTQWADFCCAVFAAASLVFTPIETMALIVREAYLHRGRHRGTI